LVCDLSERPTSNSFFHLNMSILETYKHEPLEAGQIRILFIKRAILSKELSCCIYHITPGEIPYVAISYAWPDDLESNENVNIPMVHLKEVKLDDGSEAIRLEGNITGITLPVQKSVLEMITSLSNMGENKDLEDEADIFVNPLWIDQICIDQSNNKEKSEQVQRMHEIYKKAASTIIYLGEATDETSIAYEAAHALAALDDIDEDKIPLEGENDIDAFEKPLKMVDWAALHSIPLYEKRYFEFKKGDEEIRPFRSFAVDILNRRWFDRTWVVQEIVCSQNAHIMTGGFSIPWNTCVTACKVAERLGYVARFTLHSTARYCEHLEELRERYWHNKNFNGTIDDSSESADSVAAFARSVFYRSLPQILPPTLYRGATDPRDKIFAMLNITSEPFTEDMIHDFVSIIDYDLPLRMVYIRACYLWHMGSNSPYNYQVPGQSAWALSFLDWVLDSTEGDKIGLPSWVPHWMQSGPAAMMFAPNCAAATKKNATSPKPYVTFPSPDQYMLNEVPLMVRGIRLFPIHRVCTTDWTDSIYGEYADVISQFSNPYPTTELSLTKALSLALAPMRSKFICPVSRTSKFWDFMKTSTKIYDKNQAQAALTKSEIQTDFPKELVMDRYGTNSFSKGRSFFISVNGFMGLAPKNSREGDDVVLLFGGRSPYVVRKLPSGRYNFIGACFPVGLMNGEALDGYSEDDVDDFVLI
jgi:hypothetical protein